jgi:hypothetical protein
MTVFRKLPTSSPATPTEPINHGDAACSAASGRFKGSENIVFEVS